MPPAEMKEDYIEIAEAIIVVRPDGIIQISYREGVEINIELQMRMYELFNGICRGTKRPFLFTAMDGVSVTPEARENAIKMESIFPGCATAVLAKTLAYKLVANFYLKVNRPKTPYRVFNDEKEAVQWLLSFNS